MCGCAAVRLCGCASVSALAHRLVEQWNMLYPTVKQTVTMACASAPISMCWRPFSRTQMIIGARNSRRVCDIFFMCCVRRLQAAASRATESRSPTARQFRPIHTHFSWCILCFEYSVIDKLWSRSVPPPCPSCQSSLLVKQLCRYCCSSSKAAHGRAIECRPMCITSADSGAAVTYSPPNRSARTQHKVSNRCSFAFNETC